MYRACAPIQARDVNIAERESLLTCCMDFLLIKVISRDDNTYVCACAVVLMKKLQFFDVNQPGLVCKVRN